MIKRILRLEFYPIDASSLQIESYSVLHLTMGLIVMETIPVVKMMYLYTIIFPDIFLTLG